MTEKNFSIRVATVEDACDILDIYAPYVTDTAITFEYDVPSLEEFRERIRKTLIKFPYLVAVENNKIIGYAYVSAFHERAAYDWAVETTIYMDMDYRGCGAGKKLYFMLEEIMKKQHVRNMNACIAYPNPGSIGFHEHLGYKEIGHFHQCGYKFDTWYDMIWMEKMIGDHNLYPEKVIPFSAVKKDFF